MSNTAPALVAALATAAIATAACDRDHRNGIVQKATGQVESTVGHLTHNYALEHDGERDKFAGQSATGDVKNTIKR